jgi:hypothetical protein
MEPPLCFGLLAVAVAVAVLLVATISVHGAGEERRSVRFGFGTFSPQKSHRP